MCPTLLSLLSLGFCVSLRIWAAMGEYEKPSLSAWPSPVVPLGQTVTLWCHSSRPFVIFRLFKRDGTSLPKLQGHSKNFTLGPVTRKHAGSYTCSASRSRFVWSDVSDPLPIVVTVSCQSSPIFSETSVKGPSVCIIPGVFPKPSISAHPGPLVHEGENVTFRCNSSMLLDKFILHKKSSTGHFQRCEETLTGGHAPADFVIGSMTLASVGSYRCYGSLSHSPYEWSAPSDPVDIIITGRSRKPSLSAQGGPVVTSGENMTLVCSSESAFDQFHLLKEGENLGRPLAEVRGPRGALQAEFPLGPGTPAHSGVYRCYGSFTHSPYSWSDSSDPLFLSVTGSTTSTCPSTMGPHTTEETQHPQEHSSTWYIVLGLVIAFTSTSIFLAALVCHCCSTPNHVASMEGEPMEERTVNGEDSAAEDVVYAHLDLRTLSKRQSTPASLRPMHPSAEPIIYEEFNINQDHAEP